MVPVGIRENDKGSECCPFAIVKTQTYFYTAKPYSNVSFRA
jgi:hypothetical protein